MTIKHSAAGVAAGLCKVGATLGDFFDKPEAKGGLDICRPAASAVLLAAIAVGLWVFPQRAGETRAQGLWA